MRIQADLDVCIGAGNCAMTAPDVFDQDPEDGRVVILGDPTTANIDGVRRAVWRCPSGALSLHEDPA
jgi:ferredoxin